MKTLFEEIFYEVPFYANTSDNTHCVQAALKSILKYFIPEKDFTWDELDKATAKPKDKWTWPMAGIMWMQEQGLEVHNIRSFDYQRFIKDGNKYMQERYGPEIAATQAKMSDIPQERKISKEFVKKISTQNRPASFDDIYSYLSRGYLAGAGVNSHALDGIPGYSGHFVVIVGIKPRHLIIHDPGLPPRPNRVVTFEQFDKGWAYSGADHRDLVAYKKR